MVMRAPSETHTADMIVSGRNFCGLAGSSLDHKKHQSGINHVIPRDCSIFSVLITVVSKKISVDPEASS